MANLAEELKAAMLECLGADAGFSSGVEGRIFGAEPRESPAAWIGATAFDDAGAIDLVATIHVKLASGTESASLLCDLARATFESAPAVDGISSWTIDYQEVRLDEEHSAYHGLVRFRATARLTPLPL